MAQVFKSIKFPQRVQVGGKTFLVAEVELGTEYLAKGVVVKASDLGLTTINLAVPVSEIVLAAEGTEGLGPSIVLVKPGETGSEIKIQAFGGAAGAKAVQQELADKAATATEGK